MGSLQRRRAGRVRRFSPAWLSPLAWYDPSDLSTLWQDTSATSPVTTDGQSVARIDDKSGNGYHLTQSNAGRQPLYKTSGGLHWLLFDGSDDFLSNAGFAGSLTDLTVITGAREVSRLPGALYNWGGAGTPRLQAYAPFSDNNGYIDTYSAGAGRISVLWPLAVGTDYVLVHRRSGSTASAHLNGSSLGTATISNAITSGAMIMGAALTTPAGPGNYRVYGSVIVASYVADVGAPYAWMGAKAGITI